jgi:putative oxidoreductase
MIPERYAPMTYALFRIVFGLLFLCFGLQKMFGWFGGDVPPLMSMRGIAGVIETFAGLLIMIGLLTRAAAFIASGEMAVAYWYIHVTVIAMGAQGAGLPLGLLPIMNNGVNAALFCFAFLYIATRGAGIWSVDYAMGGRSAATRTTAASPV